MAIEIFVVGGEFGEGFAGGAEEENGVVTEAAHAARSVQNFAFDGVGENGDLRPRRASASTQTKRARRSRAAARLHFGEELGDAIGRGGVRSGVARRIHAGFAAESIDDEPGIVGEHGQGGKAAVMRALPAAFSAKVGADSSNGGSSEKFGRSWRSSGAGPGARRGEGAKFVQLARIGRREKQTKGLGATGAASGREH